MKQLDRIKVLFAKVERLAESKENRNILSRWTQLTEDVSVTEGASVWHGVPMRKVDNKSPISFTVDPEIQFWSKALIFDMKEFYTNPLCYLENQLKMKIFRYENFRDDSYITKNISIFLGVSLEPSLFGVKTVYSSDRDPWNAIKDYVVKNEEDLKKLECPDFYKSGLMPLAHKFYEEINSLLPDGFTVTFPLWGRGPFGVAQHLMGLEQLLLNIALNPNFVDGLFKFITDCNKNWLMKRAEFLNIEIEKGVLYNDEVNCQVFSPDTYKDLVFPYEKEIAEFQNGITYWHSCGNTSPILKYVKQLNNLELYDSSAWSDLETSVAELRDSNTAIEVRMNPVTDVLYANEKEIRAKLNYIVESCKGIPITIRADGMQLMRSIKEDLTKITMWSDIAREVLRHRK